MAEKDPLLRTEELTKNFGALVANDNVTFGIEDGEVCGIIGPNGSGKSTFFNNITNFYTPDSGHVYFDGEEITGMKPHLISQRGLVRTFQIVTPFEDLTVEENLLAVYSKGIRISSEKRERAREVLDLVDLDHVADHEASDLSGGQQKLLEFARALMLDPKCVMLDEPTAGINPALQDRLLDYIRKMNDQGTTFVIVEHDMNVIQDITTSVSVFSKGRIIAEGAFEEVKELETVQEAYLGGEMESEVEVLS
jgi:branched-chain amino acid transport system ATP-binding protein